MCGIFGFVRNPNSTTAVSTAVLKELGICSIERGRDSSGLALVPFSSESKDRISAPTKAEVSSTFANYENTYVYKDLQPFDVFWQERERDLIQDANDSVVVMGHTRKATQGSAFDMQNASPLATGSVIGTHNGDVDKFDSSIFSSAHVLYGSTDTEKLYSKISHLNSHRGKIVRLLKDLPGRMALAWVDRTYPGRMYLARAAFSPLAIAWDAQGNLYWASNPSWFREIDALFDGAVGFRDITMIAEGRLMTIEFGSHIPPTITNVRTFTPIARHSDEATADIFVWRGFSTEDERIDKSENLTHRVKPRTVSTFTKGGYVKTKPKAQAQSAVTRDDWNVGLDDPFDSWSQQQQATEEAIFNDDLYSLENREVPDDEFFAELEHEADAQYTDLRDPSASYAGKNSYGFQDENDPFWNTKTAEKAFFLIDQMEWEYNIPVTDAVAAVFFDWARQEFNVGPILAVANLRELQSKKPLADQIRTAVQAFMKDFALTEEADAVALIELIRLYNNEKIQVRPAPKVARQAIKV